MKENTKRRLYLTLCILGAFLAGATAMNLFYMRIRPVYRDVMRVTFHQEQELRASRATRSGDPYRALVHRWNVVDSHPQGEIDVFDRGAGKDEDSDFWFPLRIYILGEIGKGAPARGQRIVEGIDCGQLALSLDSIGAARESERYWEMAQKFMNGKTLKDTKEFAINMRRREDTDIQKKVEQMYLKK